jgi:hypothetical protein
VQLHFTTRVRYGFLSVQLNYTIRRPFYFSALYFEIELFFLYNIVL